MPLSFFAFSIRVSLGGWGGKGFSFDSLEDPFISRFAFAQEVGDVLGGRRVGSVFYGFQQGMSARMIWKGHVAGWMDVGLAWNMFRKVRFFRTRGMEFSMGEKSEALEES